MVSGTDTKLSDDTVPFWVSACRPWMAAHARAIIAAKQFVQINIRTVYLCQVTFWCCLSIYEYYFASCELLTINACTLYFRSAFVSRVLPRGVDRMLWPCSCVIRCFVSMLDLRIGSSCGNFVMNADIYRVPTSLAPLPSAGEHSSYGDCLEVKRKYQNWSWS